ncbi:MAG TPA: 2-amino-4-hydroxy-6-hydroxymethyldihydropteridine diphosphokinase [Pirellulaceae bacterium]|nr:2-amino-4-hydroxy-6-hydroxymethyldihydropteridine diphosphokinase [Pirellulaceae bacterium]HMO92125.1 2-amino-4-hydroxy-6-hydroxymethyldihydropteridine diphosphokinase [Pirellulaceae bacterium]HMP69287.1 2-amino-4-hydroxy-6-hydroxymethyldihydropteridine diphosphokinase [Pirellulaceae bacterium]
MEEHYQDCLVAFGSNLGDRERFFHDVIDALNQHSRFQIVSHSDLYSTTPIGGVDPQHDYLNAAIRLVTNLPAIELADYLFQLEKSLGRQRKQRWEARTVDLDLLLYGQQNFESNSLVIPHPRMSYRRFVLEPACQIAAEMVHPTSQLTLGQLLEHINTKRGALMFVGCTVNQFSVICQSTRTQLFINPIEQDMVAGEVNSLMPHNELQNLELEIVDSLGGAAANVILVNDCNTFDEFQHLARLIVILPSPATTERSLNIVKNDVDEISLQHTQDLVELIHSASRFRGPVLQIRDWREAGREIDAALAAMR